MNITIYFDGGCEPNPGFKYGSYEVFWDGIQILRQERVDLGKGTCNEAEFETLELALQEASRWLTARAMAVNRYQLQIFTDSQIVRNRMTRFNRIYKKPKWREASERMFNLASRCLDLTFQFRDCEVEWQPREQNVERFGH